MKGDPVEEFLLMCHSERLDLPKGHVDSGETETQCALRELEEETGIASGDIQLDGQFRFETTYPVRYKRHGNKVLEKTLVIFLGRLRGDVAIRPTEHISFRWVKWDPPHVIQAETIDPLLGQLAEFLDSTA